MEAKGQKERKETGELLIMYENLYFFFSIVAWVLFSFALISQKKTAGVYSALAMVLFFIVAASSVNIEKDTCFFEPNCCNGTLYNTTSFCHTETYTDTAVMTLNSIFGVMALLLLIFDVFIRVEKEAGSPMIDQPVAD